jgi:hypothetical protein
LGGAETPVRSGVWNLRLQDATSSWCVAKRGK